MTMNNAVITSKFGAAILTYALNINNIIHHCGFLPQKGEIYSSIDMKMVLISQSPLGDPDVSDHTCLRMTMLLGSLNGSES